jgi:hypothetical protein
VYPNPLSTEETAEHAHERAVDARSVLLISLGSAEERVRSGDSQLLQGLGVDVLSDLILTLRNPSALARLEVMKILKAFGRNAKAALDALKAQTDDPDAAVREAAAEAIKAVSAGADN